MALIWRTADTMASVEMGEKINGALLCLTRSAAGASQAPSQTPFSNLYRDSAGGRPLRLNPLFKVDSFGNPAMRLAAIAKAVGADPLSKSNASGVGQLHTRHCRGAPIRTGEALAVS